MLLVINTRSMGAPLAACPVLRLVLDRFGAVLLVLAVAVGAAEPAVGSPEGIQPPDGAVGAHTDTHDQPWRVHGHQRGSCTAGSDLAIVLWLQLNDFYEISVMRCEHVNRFDTATTGYPWAGGHRGPSTRKPFQQIGPLRPARAQNILVD